MINLTLNITQNILPAFCWMLIHSLWIGLLLCMLTSCVMFATRKSSSATRYNLLAGLFVTFVLVCAGIFFYELSFIAPHNKEEVAGGLLNLYASKEILRVLSVLCAEYSGWISMSWLVLFVLKCIRLRSSVNYIKRLRSAEQFVVDGKWKETLDGFAQTLQIRQAVRLVESGIATVPVVVGYAKPVIYMPLGLIMNLPSDQVEAVLLHELAHIKRNDYLFNFFQNIAEAIFFFNPALLWVSSILKQEREYCCDDIALQSGKEKRLFIEALISFKEYSTIQNRYALAFPGRKDSLLKRVTRIVKNTNETLNPKEKIFFLLSIVMTAFLVIAVRKETAVQAPVILAKSVDSSVTLSRDLFTAAPVVENSVITFSTDTKTAETQNSKPLTAKNFAALSDDLNEEVSTDKIESDLNADIQLSERIEAEKLITDAAVEQARREAEIARDYAAIQREIAEQNRRQADRDRAIAEKDRIQAERDREQANHDRERADQERAAADIERERADLQRAHADEDRMRAEMDRKKSEREREERRKKTTITNL